MRSAARSRSILFKATSTGESRAAIACQRATSAWRSPAAASSTKTTPLAATTCCHAAPQRSSSPGSPAPGVSTSRSGPTSSSTAVVVVPGKRRDRGALGAGNRIEQGGFTRVHRGRRWPGGAARRRRTRHAALPSRPHPAGDAGRPAAWGTWWPWPGPVEVVVMTVARLLSFPHPLSTWWRGGEVVC